MGVKAGENGLASDINNTSHFVAGESISSGDAVSLNYSDYKIYKASAAAFDHRLNFIGFAMAAATLNNPVQINVLTVVHEKTGLTANTVYYLSNTQGAIGTSAGTCERIIGRAISTTKLIRKRGVVTNNPFTVPASFTAPCDGVFWADTGNIDQLFVGSFAISHDVGATVMVGMGSSCSGATSGSNTFGFTCFDAGGFY